jgi:hypothetical protein
VSEARSDDVTRARVREIFLADWDPHDAARNVAAHGTYDGYITPLLDLLRAGADEDAIVHFLKEREAESMCFPAAGSGHLRRVARKLMAVL